MDTFFTWEYLLSFAGCVLATGLLTQFTKNVFRNVPTQIVSYAFALIILVVGQLATGKIAGWGDVFLDLINAVVVSLSSNGAYDAINRAFGPKTDVWSELEYEGDK